ncbi:MAG: hypothetical protein CM15mP80_06980 [Alphaproteobacteria bacterium]|nr:MAG: hypothetical protein CM15mP80_06980 [Alphaproteobacteria bacterium]
MVHPLSGIRIWLFYPYTNDDVLAVGIIIDDMESKNGPLMVYPGTHKGPIYNHHINGVFAGGMSVSDAGLKSEDAVELKVLPARCHSPWAYRAWVCKKYV